MIAQNFIILFLFFSISLQAQYQTYKYTSSDGMRSSLVRCIVKDKSGYIWIGSDGGVMRFDGKKFIAYHELLPSIFIKAMYITSSGTFYVAHDRGFGSIEVKGTQYSYKQIVRVGNSQADTALYFPKSLFEDSRGRIWIGDLTGISIYKNGTFKKYYFSSTEHSDSYFRGFSVTENNEGDIYVTSMKGNLFRYDEKNDKFVMFTLLSNYRINYISSVLSLESGDLVIGTNSGIYRAEINKEKQSAALVRIADRKDISSIVKGEGNSLIYGTWNEGIHIVAMDGTEAMSKNLSEYPSVSVKALFFDTNGLWVGTDDGLLFFQKSLFSVARRNPNNESGKNTGIRDILYDKVMGEVLLSDGRVIEAFNVVTPDKPARLVFRTTGQDILHFAVSPTGYWIAYLNNLIEFRDKRTLKILYSYLRQDDSFHSLYVDDNDNLWGYLPLTKQIVRISKSKDIRYYPFQKHEPIYINKIESIGGRIVAAGTTDDILFYEIDPGSEKINAHFLSNKETRQTSIQVFDFISGGGNKIIFSTSEGVLQVNLEDNKVNLGGRDLAGELIKGIINDNKGNEWYGGEGKVFVKHKQEFLNFNKQDGLFEGSVLQQGLLLDKFNRVWVGYPQGVVYSDTNLSDFNVTPRPELVSIAIDDSNIYSGEVIELQPKNNLKLEFISPSFPGYGVLYQYRIREISERWSEPAELSTVKLFALPPGDYTFQFRAKKPNRLWSEVNSIKLSVVPPWYLSAYAFVFYSIMVIILFLGIVIKYNNYRLLKAIRREKELSELVSLRTSALESEKKKTEALLVEKEKAYSELTDLNEQKNILIGMVVHDLKNPIHAIMGYADLISEGSTDAEIKNYSEVIADSSQKMVDLINQYLEASLMDENLVNYNPEMVSSLEAVTEAVKINQLLAKKKNQVIITELNQDCKLYADKELITRAIANVINNAIKYSKPGSSIFVRDGLNQGYFELRVKDEGPGFSEEDKRHLFSKLTRLSAKPTGGESSTGVGLYYVKIIINKCGGEIVLEESGQNGSTFLFRLPIYDGVTK